MDASVTPGVKQAGEVSAVEFDQPQFGQSVLTVDGWNFKMKTRPSCESRV